MNLEELLQCYLDCMQTRVGDREGDLTLGCRWCLSHTYASSLWNNDFDDVAERLLAHLRDRHPEKMVDLTPPVTDEEIAEVFGLSLPLPTKLRR